MKDNAELAIEILKNELECNSKRVWSEIAEMVGTSSIEDHLRELERVTTLDDVVEACQEYIADVKHRLATEVISHDLMAKYLGVEVE